MSDENEYSGSGSFVGGSEPEAAKAPKKSSVADRQVVKNNSATVADAKNVDQSQVGKDALAISDSLGNPEPPIGSVLYGVAKEVAPYVLGGLGLKAAWDVLSSNKSQTSNDGANGGWDKTTAGKPANATLGAPAPQATTVPAAATTAAPIPETAPAAGPAPAPLGVPNPSQQVAMPGEQQPQMKYGETKYNVPTASPEVAVAPPSQTATAPVEPKPLTAREQRDQYLAETAKVKLEDTKAQAAHNEQVRANKLADEAQRAEAKKQKTTSSGGVKPEARQMLNSSENAKIDKAVIAQQKASTPKPAPIAPPTVAAPAVDIQPTTPVAAAPAVEGAVAPKSGPTAKWPGGAEGSAVQLFGGTKKNFTPESQAAVEMFKDFVGGPLSMPPTGGSINQIPEASKFYEKHTGSPLPRNAEGKLTRIPEEQMQKLHSGIRTELEDAVKGNKLGSLGKGAMAAAALLGLSGAVQAAQKGDFGPLRQAGFDIGGPIALGKLGIAALSRAAGAGFSAATYAGDAGEANEAAQVAKKFADAQKLGSPYRSVPSPKK